MRILTVHRPWAWAIVSGHKTVENRTWATRYRGSVLIHAGLQDSPEGHIFLAKLGLAVPQGFPGGVIVGVVNLVDCIDKHAAGGILEPLGGETWATGPVCWMLEGAIAFRKPIAWRGVQGLIAAPPRVYVAARRRMLGSAEIFAARV